MSRSRLAAVVWILGLGAAGAQALALAARYFQPWLSADYIYPQLFAEDVLAGRYPMAGWTLSSAPYFFPDLALAVLLRALGGPGTILPAYVVCSCLAFAVLAGWSLQAATRTGWTAWLGGVALVNGLLAWQVVGDHAHYLWLLGTVGFHGGAILLGLANFALWAGTDDAVLSRGRRATALAILFFGALSDTLFLTQMAVPLAFGLWARGGWQWREPRLVAYVRTLGVAVVLVAVLRGALALTGWFSFSKVFRYAPTPSAVGAATSAFWRDILTTLVPGAWGFVLVAAVAMIVTGIVGFHRSRQPGGMEHSEKLVLGFGLAALATTTLLPLVTAYWRDAQHVRYVLPWLFVPGWLAMAMILPVVAGWGGSRRALAITAVALLGLSVAAWPRIQRSALLWPYSTEQAELDAFLSVRNLRHGLSDYWHAHYINAVSHASPRLFALRPQANASFWNNNAYWFYDSDPATGRLVRPEYSFIITNGLDEPAVLRRFGPPTGRERVGELTIWFYSGEEKHRLAAELEPEVRTFLRGRPGESRIASSP